MGSRYGDVAKRAFVAASAAALVLLLLVLLWYSVEVLLVVFAGVLLAIFLRGVSGWLGEHLHLANGWSLAIVLVVLVGLAGAWIWLLAPNLAEQVGQLAEQLPRAVSQLQQRLEQYGWGRWLLAQVPRATELLTGRGDLLGRATSFFSTTFGALVDLVIFLFVGLYLTLEPRLYIEGVLKLIHPEKRERARQVLGAVGYTLQWWLVGRIIAMVLIGLLTTVGLWALGVPLALTFGILAGLLNFIPNFGPIISAVPPILVALVQSFPLALYVGLLYLGVQTLETYVLTPLLQQRTIYLPPALTIVTQVLLGVLAGGLGLALATPLTGAALVLVKMLYIEETLGDAAKIPGELEL